MSWIPPLLFKCQCPVYSGHGKFHCVFWSLEWHLQALHATHTPRCGLTWSEKSKFHQHSFSILAACSHWFLDSRYNYQSHHFRLQDRPVQRDQPEQIFHLAVRWMSNLQMGSYRYGTWRFLFCSFVLIYIQLKINMNKKRIACDYIFPDFYDTNSVYKFTNSSLNYSWTKRRRKD